MFLHFIPILGVYFEKVLKASDTSLWIRNIQMYISGIVITAFGVYLNDGAQVLEKGFFFGYTHWVWIVICEYNDFHNGWMYSRYSIALFIM